MNGQGSPPRVDPQRQSSLLSVGICLLSCCAQLVAAETGQIDLRVQIVWGGSEARLWRGSVSVPGGEVSGLRLLGMDADQPGSFIVRDGRVLVEPRFDANYSGFEANLVGPRDGELLIALSRSRDNADPPIRIPLSDLRQEEFRHNLNGHRLRVARVMGDNLRVRLEKDALVFSPGEPIRLDLVPHEIAAKPGGLVRARLRLRHAEDRRNELADFWEQDLWNRVELLRVGESRQVARLEGIEIPAPAAEGVYNLTIELSPHRLTPTVTIPQIGSVGLPTIGSIANRVIQLVVIDPRQPPLYGEGGASLVTEFDPADPKWFERLSQLPQWKLLPRVKRPWGNVEPEIWRTGDRSWSKLSDQGWIAYSLPIRDAAMPHVVQVEFPPNLPQDVGVTVLEPNASGEYAPVSLDSGITIGDRDLRLPNVSAPATTTHHRLVFWPKTSSPVLVISNRQIEGSIAFGRIRLESYRQGLPAAHLSTKGSRRRIAMLDGHRLKDVFLAAAAINQKSRVVFDDWQTFYESATRLAGYLRYAGYDGVALSVLGDGSSLYPSPKLYATAEYDRGIFADTGQDPVRKDVLEMLLRVFDRENLTFIPTIEFATPLPALESQLAANNESSKGIELVSVRGQLGSDLQRARRAPYYNPLDARVQLAIQHIVRELVARYGKHPSFGGVNLRLSELGYTQFPDMDWGFDQGTLDRFADRLVDDSRNVSAHQTSRLLRQQIAKRQSTPLTRQWLQWRAGELSDFYGQLADNLRPGNEAKLYLSMADLASSAPWQRHLRPSLIRKSTVEDAMLELGLDTHALAGHSRIVLLRPHRLAPTSRLATRAVNLEIMQPDVHKLFSNLFSTEDYAASQFLHEPQLTSIDSFDKLGPPAARNATTLESVFTRAGVEARRPYARSLAAYDDHIMLDGGSVIPLGQEVATRSFFHVYRQLPARPFRTLKFEETSPLVVRFLKSANGAYLYAVNTSPWPAETSFRWKTSPDCVVSALGQHEVETTRILDQTDADVVIEPYGLVAFKFTSPDVEVVRCHPTMPSGVAKQLSIQLADVVARANQNRQRPEPISLLRDSGFESTISTDADSAWTASYGADGSVTSDSQIRAEGDVSLHLKSDRAPVTVYSHEFSPPETGRLIMTLKLRSSSPVECPCVIGVQSNSADYRRLFRVRQQLTTEFQEVMIPVSDLPVDPEARLRISISMQKPGEVWIDDLRFFDKWFLPEQQQALHRLLMVALENEGEGDYAACYEALRGYWPRFLLRYIPPVEVAVRTSPAMPTRAPTAQRPEKPGFFDRVKDLIRLR